MRKYYFALAVILLLTCAVFAVAQTAGRNPIRPTGRPIFTSTTTTTSTATVTAIDYTNRTVTLLAPNETTRTYKVGSDVRNFDQVRRGDVLQASETERLSIYTGRGMPLNEYETFTFERARRGARPGFVATDSLSIVGKIQNVNSANSTVTIVGPNNNARTFKVANPRNLSALRTGDNIVAQYSDSITLTVRLPAGRPSNR